MAKIKKEIQSSSPLGACMNDGFPDLVFLVNQNKRDLNEDAGQKGYAQGY